METTYLDCVLASGFFKDELYVMLGDSSAFVERQKVQILQEPNGLNNGKGKVCVYVIEREADRLLVEIPGQPVVGSLRTWVSSKQLDLLDNNGI